MDQFPLDCSSFVHTCVFIGQAGVVIETQLPIVEKAVAIGGDGSGGPGPADGGTMEERLQAIDEELEALYEAASDTGMYTSWQRQRLAEVPLPHPGREGPSRHQSHRYTSAFALPRPACHAGFVTHLASPFAAALAPYSPHHPTNINATSKYITITIIMSANSNSNTAPRYHHHNHLSTFYHS